MKAPVYRPVSRAHRYRNVFKDHVVLKIIEILVTIAVVIGAPRTSRADLSLEQPHKNKHHD
jgi:hypothetical protein